MATRQQDKKKIRQQDKKTIQAVLSVYGCSIFKSWYPFRAIQNTKVMRKDREDNTRDKTKKEDEDKAA